ncbi:MAG: squalene/phytoene synthase family protein [Candidatus Kapaibacteriota bacterium]
MAKKHYENFPVASFLIPKEDRRFIYSIYTFARFADDIADSLALPLTKSERMDALETIEKNLLALHNYSAVSNPIFYALKDTIEKKELPLEPLLRLLNAFKMDVNFSQPQNWSDLEYYCSFSANPIGELVLRIFNEYNDRTIVFSNQICTGLQLVNFWQDLSLDLKRDRIYIPQNLLDRFNLEISSIFDLSNRIKVEICLKEILEKTREYFIDGWKLVWLLKNSRLRIEINATVLAGIRILGKEEKSGANLLFKRPKLNFFDFIIIFVNSFI